MALAEIVAHKRQEIRARCQLTPLGTFRDSLDPSQRSLKQAMNKPGARFILEYKKASPSLGLIRPDLTVQALINAYADVADVISVLTDQRFFQGSLESLAAIAKQVHQPILCKDFVVDPYQVFEARHYGANAVLLMLSVLDNQTWQKCYQAVQALSMEAITEVHNMQEMQRAIRLKAPIIGINNRNLANLTIDMATTPTLAGIAPPDALLICESGINNHAQVQALSPLVDGFLVGSSLMQAPRIDLAARALIYGRVKVCGLTRSQDANAAFTYGASFGGIVFVASSKRCASIKQAIEIKQNTPKLLPLVGVFADQSIDEVVWHAKQLDLYAVQLHGAESPDYISQCRAQLPASCQIWQAHRISGEIPPLSRQVDRMLLDSYQAGQLGGTGQVFNWQLLAASPIKDQILLAGGLKPDNARQASQLGTWGLDVSSGLEASPGRKDQQKIKVFFQQLRP